MSKLEVACGRAACFALCAIAAAFGSPERASATLFYSFDTAAVPQPGFFGPGAPATYVNTGTFSLLSGSYTTENGGTNVGSAGGLGFGGCTGGGCSSAMSDTASIGSAYAQSDSLSYNGTASAGTRLSTSLFANPAIPGDITTAFSLSGTDIGTGSVDCFFSPFSQSACGGFA